MPEQLNAPLVFGGWLEPEAYELDGRWLRQARGRGLCVVCNSVHANPHVQVQQVPGSEDVPAELHSTAAVLGELGAAGMPAEAVSAAGAAAEAVGTIVEGQEMPETAVRCSECRAMCDEATMLETRDGDVCQRCAANTGMCDWCHDIYMRWRLDTDGAGNRLCQDCQQDHFTCERCDEWLPESCYGENGCCDSCVNAEDEPQFYRGQKIIEGRGISVGFELEVCGVERRANQAVRDAGIWTAVHDGSIGEYGVEYNSPILFESNYEQYVRELCAELRGAASVGEECGYHLHIGADGWSWAEVALIYRYAAKYEASFMRLVPKARRDNEYCLRLPKMLRTPRNKAELVAWLYGGGGRPIGKAAKSKSPYLLDGGIVRRYWWLNIHSYFYQRTLEVRLHSGTTQANKVLAWARLWLAVVKHAPNGEKQWRHPLELVSKADREWWLNRAQALGGARSLAILQEQGLNTQRERGAEVEALEDGEES